MGFVRDWGAFVAVLLAIAGGIYKFAKLEEKVKQLNPASIQQSISEVQLTIENGKKDIEQIVKDNRTESIIVETGPGGAKFVRRISVFSYEFNGPTIRGQEHEPIFFHIRTPDKKYNSEMWRYDLKGYAYGASIPLDITWVGYYYAGAKTKNYIINEKSVNRSVGVSSIFSVSQYTGSDNHLYLKFGPINPFCINFTLDYQSGKSGERVVHSQEGFEVKISKHSMAF